MRQKPRAAGGDSSAQRVNVAGTTPPIPTPAAQRSAASHSAVGAQAQHSPAAAFSARAPREDGLAPDGVAGEARRKAPDHHPPERRGGDEGPADAAQRVPVAVHEVLEDVRDPQQLLRKTINGIQQPKGRAIAGQWARRIANFGLGVCQTLRSKKRDQRNGLRSSCTSAIIPPPQKKHLPPRTRISHLRTTWTVPCAVGCSRTCCQPCGGHLRVRGAALVEYVGTL